MPEMSLSDLIRADASHPFHTSMMQRAIAEAEAAAAMDEVPVGAILYHVERGVIAAAHNLREQRQDPTAHAEIILLAKAAKILGSWRLEDSVLYVTLEPCPMCAGAVVQARLPLVVYGCKDPKAGACHSLFQIPTDVRLNHRCQVLGGVLEQESASLLSQFFAKKRAQGKK